MGFTVVYDIEKWSILRATVTHFLIANGMMILTATILKWWNFKDMMANIISNLGIKRSYLMVLTSQEH